MFDFEVNYLFMPYYNDEMHLFGKETGKNKCTVLFCSDLQSSYKAVSFGDMEFYAQTTYTRAKRENNTIYWYGYADNVSHEVAIFNTTNVVYYYFAF